MVSMNLFYYKALEKSPWFWLICFFAQQHFIKIGVALYDLAYPRYCQNKILRAAILENGKYVQSVAVFYFWAFIYSLNKIIPLIGDNIKLRRGPYVIRTAIFNGNCGLGAAIFYLFVISAIYKRSSMRHDAFIRFPDHENIGLDTKIMILHRLVLEILSIWDSKSGHFGKWRHNLI